jgi:CubicO group peptidase (beta-lactamase class C family)
MSNEDIAGSLVGMSSREMIEFHTKGVRRARLTVGIVQKGEVSYTVYGENGKILPNKEHVYEIGSFLKVISAQLFAKAISENRVSLDDSIDRFLDLPTKDYYPTIRRLLTHTSGYEVDPYYLVLLPQNTTPSSNPFYGITEQMVLNCIGTINLENRDYPHLYSNLNFTVAGLVLEKIYNEDYTSLMNRYLKDELGLNNSKMQDGSGDLSNYWTWDKNNPYIAAGALISNVADMMKYTQMQIAKTPSYASLSYNTKVQVESAPPHHHDPELGFRLDAQGLGWFIDTANNIIWMGGTTYGYNAYIAVDLDDDIAVVVLTNIHIQTVSNNAIGATILKELRD